MTAVGFAAVADADADRDVALFAVVVGLACDAGLAELVWDIANDPAISNAAKAANILRIVTP
jgi:hypothetical protein